MVFAASRNPEIRGVSVPRGHNGIDPVLRHLDEGWVGRLAPSEILPGFPTDSVANSWNRWSEPGSTALLPQPGWARFTMSAIPACDPRRK